LVHSSSSKNITWFGEFGWPPTSKHNFFQKNKFVFIQKKSNKNLSTFLQKNKNKNTLLFLLIFKVGGRDREWYGLVG